MFERDKKTDTGDGVTSLIDADMRITGSVVSSGDIILAGGVEGEIKCRNLLIEDQALLTGNVNADEAVVAGHGTGAENLCDRTCEKCVMNEMKKNPKLKKHLEPV